MANQPAHDALVAALSDWRRHAIALVTIAVGFGIASMVGTSGAYYGAWLVAFSVWMAWFVLTAIEFLQRADF